jgi:peptide/nickel transport system ATP-binding protein
MDIQRKNKTTMLFISHDLSVVRYIADRVVVMYLGYIVEQGTTDQIFAPPYHPYTEALLSAIPIADTSVVKKHIVLEGDIPSAMNPPSGCPFQTRCRYKHLVPGNKCETEVPPSKDLGEGHMSRCWLSDEELAKMGPVISFDRDALGREDAPADPVRPPADPVRRSGPGLTVDVPRRPRGKTGTVDLSDDADAEEEADGEARMARSQGAARRPKSRSVQVGWGEQSDDAKAHSPFGKGKGPRKN